MIPGPPAQQVEAEERDGLFGNVRIFDDRNPKMTAMLA